MSRWRSRAQLMVALLAATLFCGCAAQPRLRVLSYNIHHGRGTDGVIDLERIASVIRAADADVILLQEVDVGTGRAGGVDQAGELGRLCDRVAIFGKAMDYDGGQYGEALLLRIDPPSSLNHSLPHSPDREPRAMIAAPIEIVPGGPEVLVAGTHLDHLTDPTDRLDQARAINEFVVGFDGRPAILAGDLNALPESDVMAELLEFWGDAAAGLAHMETFPSDEPDRRIDYVLFRPRWLWSVAEVTVIDERIASDHRPLLVELVWEGADPHHFVLGVSRGYGHYHCEDDPGGGGSGGGVIGGGGTLGGPTVTRPPTPLRNTASPKVRRP